MTMIKSMKTIIAQIFSFFQYVQHYHEMKTEWEMKERREAKVSKTVTDPETSHQTAERYVHPDKMIWGHFKNDRYLKFCWKFQERKKAVKEAQADKRKSKMKKHLKKRKEKAGKASKK